LDLESRENLGQKNQRRGEDHKTPKKKDRSTTRKARMGLRGGAATSATNLKFGRGDIESFREGKIHVFTSGFVIMCEIL